MKPKAKIKPSSIPLAIGQHFGDLRIESESGRPSYWNVICSRCGTHKEVRGDNLTSGRTHSCGRHRTKHGATAGGVRTPAYESWHAMRARCRDTTDKHYSGCGISVCDAWADFSIFLRDMGERPEGQTLDRINVLGDYNPKNCKWSTIIEQRDNRTDTKYLVYGSPYSYYKNTPREWAAYLARTTGKKWDTKVLKACLKLLTLTQILGATSDCRRTPDELVEERQRRARADRDAAIRGQRLARHGPGYIPTAGEPCTEDEIDAAVKEMLCGSDFEPDPESVANGLPTNLSPAALQAIADMEYFTMY